MSNITMSRKERQQLIVFNQIKAKQITKKEASEKLGISDRWLRIKYKRYLTDGDIGLVHQNRGRISKRRWDDKEKELAIALLKSDWHGFGPKFTSEKLQEIHGITISKETVRKAMIESRIREPRKRKMKHRAWRERKGMIGIMVQLDGSNHDWFEGRGPKCTLLVYIDDATSRLLWIEFAESESYNSIFSATKAYFMRHGIPQSFYTDHGSVFSTNNSNLERQTITQFERALQEVETELIHARSPQAKGRVERVNQTLQDRLVKEMRLAGISSMEAANDFVRKSDYIARHNELFAVPPRQDGDAHRSAELLDLESILCVKEERKLTNDFTVSYKNRMLQLSKLQQIFICPKDTIVIYEHLDGSLALYNRSTKLNFTEIGMKKSGRLLSGPSLLQNGRVGEASQRVAEGI